MAPYGGANEEQRNHKGTQIGEGTDGVPIQGIVQAYYNVTCNGYDDHQSGGEGAGQTNLALKSADRNEMIIQDEEAIDRHQSCEPVPAGVVVSAAGLGTHVFPRDVEPVELVQAEADYP